jgi:hypothetical protein
MKNCTFFDKADIMMRLMLMTSHEDTTNFKELEDLEDRGDGIADDTSEKEAELTLGRCYMDGGELVIETNEDSMDEPQSTEDSWGDDIGAIDVDEPDNENKDDEMDEFTEVEFDKGYNDDSSDDDGCGVDDDAL